MKTTFLLLGLLTLALCSSLRAEEEDEFEALADPERSDELQEVEDAEAEMAQLEADEMKPKNAPWGGRRRRRGRRWTRGIRRAVRRVRVRTKKVLKTYACIKYGICG